MANKRVYYPIHAVGFAPLGTTLYTSGYKGAKGVQSFSSNTNFSLDPVYELGQLDVYENIENLPNIECTVSKVIDGYSLLEHLATPGATVNTLAGRYNDNRCMLACTFYDITQSFASGTPLSTVVMSGMYVSAINWSFPLEGNATESITLVCNDKTWNYSPSGQIWGTGTQFTGAESPVSASGGVQRRQDVSMAASRWPTDIPGISGVALSGVNPTLSNGEYGAHIGNVTISTNLGRTDLFEQGRRGPYFRYANFPTEVTTSIEVVASERGDNVNADSTIDNLTNQYIKIVLNQGVTLDLGTKNKLQSVTMNGGDTGGGNVSCTYTYSNYNTLTVSFTSQDPAGL